MSQIIEGVVNYTGNGKMSGEPGCFIKGHDGWLNLDGVSVKKGQKIKAKVNGKNIVAVKVLEEPKPSGGYGGRRGGGGFNKSPEQQRSIVMQHSQEMAIRWLAHTGVKDEAALDAAIAKFYTQAADEGPREFIDSVDTPAEVETAFDDDFPEQEKDDEDEGWDD